MEFCEKLFATFEKYGYGDITNIKLGKSKIENGLWKNYFISYCKKDLQGLDLIAETFN